MKALVTGATGFTGSHLVPLLRSRGVEVRCLARTGSDVSALQALGVELAVGDLDDPASLRRAFAGCGALYNVASLGFGHAPAIVRAAQEAGMERAVFVGTTAVFTSLAAPSKKARLAAEEAITGSGLAYTIIRPTMIYGTRRDRNMCRLARYLNQWPLIPILGPGTYLQQPVHVRDVAWAVAEAMERDACRGRAYNIAGAAPLSLNQVIDTICALLGRRVRKLHLPAGAAVKLLRALERRGMRLPIKAEQIERLNENKNFDYGPAQRDFGFAPLSFQEGAKLLIADLGLGPRP